MRQNRSNTIMETVNGEFILKKGDNQLGKPFADKPAAEKGLKRAISPPTYLYDAKGKPI